LSQIASYESFPESLKLQAETKTTAFLIVEALREAVPSAGSKSVSCIDFSLDRTLFEDICRAVQKCYQGDVSIIPSVIGTQVKEISFRGKELPLVFDITFNDYVISISFENVHPYANFYYLTHIACCSLGFLQQAITDEEFSACIIRTHFSYDEIVKNQVRFPWSNFFLIHMLQLGPVSVSGLNHEVVLKVDMVDICNIDLRKLLPRVASAIQIINVPIRSKK